MNDYVHGHDRAARERLIAQADAVAHAIHGFAPFPPGSHVLEAGCGVGAQTITLLRRNPACRFTLVDRHGPSLEEALARARAEAGEPGRVAGRVADAGSLPFPDGHFDHVFVCFLLEHVPDPSAVLAELLRVLAPGGRLVAVEGDHGSTLLFPPSDRALAAVACQVELQRRAGGDACLGRRLYPLLAGAGLRAVAVEPCVVHADAGRPELREAFVRRTFTDMVRGVREDALRAGLLEAAAFDEGIAALERTAEGDGTFAYTFFRGEGLRPA
jgi:SAM-dependent methyltransferase